MKRAYEVEVERGDRVYAREYIVVSATDEEAVRKAKRMAVHETGVTSGWRCTRLMERGLDVIV